MIVRQCALPAEVASVWKKRKLEELEDAPTTVLEVVGLGPKAAVAKLDGLLEGASEVALAVWRRNGRVAAVMSSCPKTFGSIKAAVNNWIEYIAVAYGREHVCQHAFPPKLSDVLAWANMFRHCMLAAACALLCSTCFADASVLTGTTSAACARHATLGH